MEARALSPHHQISGGPKLKRSNARNLEPEEVDKRSNWQKSVQWAKIMKDEEKHANSHNIDKIAAILVAISWSSFIDVSVLGLWKKILVALIAYLASWGLLWPLTKLDEHPFEQIVMVLAEFNAFLWRDTVKALLFQYEPFEQKFGHHGSETSPSSGPSSSDNSTGSSTLLRFLTAVAVGATVPEVPPGGGFIGHGAFGSHGSSDRSTSIQAGGSASPRLLVSGSDSHASSDHSIDLEEFEVWHFYSFMYYYVIACGLLWFSIFFVGTMRRLRLQKIVQRRLTRHGRVSHTEAKSMTMRVAEAMIDVELDSVGLATGYAAFSSICVLCFGPHWFDCVESLPFTTTQSIWSWTHFRRGAGLFFCLASVAVIIGIIVLRMMRKWHAEDEQVQEDASRFLVLQQSIGFAAGFVIEVCFLLLVVPLFQQRIGGEDSHLTVGVFLFPCIMLPFGHLLVSFVRARAVMVSRKIGHEKKNQKQLRIVVTLACQLAIALSFEQLFERAIFTAAPYEPTADFLLLACGATVIWVVACLVSQRHHDALSHQDHGDDREVHSSSIIKLDSEARYTSFHYCMNEDDAEEMQFPKSWGVGSEAITLRSSTDEACSFSPWSATQACDDTVEQPGNDSTTSSKSASFKRLSLHRSSLPTRSSMKKTNGVLEMEDFSKKRMLPTNELTTALSPSTLNPKAVKPSKRVQITGIVDTMEITNYKREEQ